MKAGTRAVDASTRIQLEGHLETVERQLEEWRAAAAALKGRKWEHDLRWVSLLHSAPAADEAVRVVSSKLVPGENDGLLRDLAAAQAMVADRAASRLTSLGKPPLAAGALELLRELKLHRPLCVVNGQLAGARLDLGGRVIVATLGGFTAWLLLLVAMIAFDPEHVTPSFFERLALAFGYFVLPASWAVWSHRRSRRRLVLTEERLSCEGGEPNAVPLSSLEEVTATSRSGEWRLSTRSARSSPLEAVETSVHPGELLARLERLGVKVTTVTAPHDEGR